MAPEVTWTGAGGGSPLRLLWLHPETEARAAALASGVEMNL